MAKTPRRRTRVQFVKITKWSMDERPFAGFFVANPHTVYLFIRPGHKNKDSAALRKEYRRRNGRPIRLSDGNGQTGTVCKAPGTFPFCIVAGLPGKAQRAVVAGVVAGVVLE